MGINVHDAGPQKDGYSLIPPGVYRLRARVIAGDAGSDGNLLRAKNGPSLGLKLECTVIEGEHHGKKVWDWITCELDEGALAALTVDKRENFLTAVRLGRKRLRAILDSAYNIDPSDNSEAARAKHDFDDYMAFNGLMFYAQIEERAATNSYKASNTIDFIVTPDDPEYQKQAKKTALALQKDLDDALPF